MSQCIECTSKIRQADDKRKEYSRERRRSFSKNPVEFDKHIERCNQLILIEKIRKTEDGYLEVKCTYCGKWFKPTGVQVEMRASAINGKFLHDAENRFYCSNNCKKMCPIYRKHPKSLMIQDAMRAGNYENDRRREVQPELRQMVFDRDNYTCLKCGKTDVSLQCHHIEGIRWNPLESADMDQCITVCDICHDKIHQIAGCGYNDLKCKKTV